MTKTQKRTRRLGLSKQAQKDAKAVVSGSVIWRYVRGANLREISASLSDVQRIFAACVKECRDEIKYDLAEGVIKK